MSHRRRAHNFTDSLNSFRSVPESETDLEPDSLDAFSKDSFDTVSVTSSNSRATSNTKGMPHTLPRRGKHSILAGSNTFNHSVSPPDISYNIRKPKLDLDKRIDLFLNSFSDNDDWKDKENKNPIYRKKNGSTTGRESKELGNPTSIEATCTNQLLGQKRVKKCMDIHNSSRHHLYKGCTAPKTSTPSNKPCNTVSNTDQYITTIDMCGSEQQNKQSGTPVQEFENILCFLDNELNEMKEAAHSKPILKRLSQKFMHSPRDFTEKLLSIIEESVVNDNNEDVHDTSAINLSRLTEEFKKMCKFIEDETPPEWPPSPSFLTPNLNQAHQSNLAINRKNRSQFNFMTPSPTIQYLKSSSQKQKRMPKRMLTNSLDNIADDSFEQLEAQCNKLFPHDPQEFQPLDRAMSLPSLLTMDDLHKICKEQWAALDTTINTNVVNKEASGNYKSQTDLNFNKTTDSHKDLNLPRRISLTSKAEYKSEGSSQTNLEKGNNVDNNLFTNPDELEKTLLESIVAKRNRCLNTAKLIMKINADSQTPPMQNLQSPMQNTEVKFLDTLMSCKKYHSYLKQKKPLLNFLGSDVSTVSNESDNKQNMNLAEETNVVNQKTSSAKSTKKSHLHLESKQVNKNIDSLKKRLFISPNNSPRNQLCGKKRVLFPQMMNDVVKKSNNIVKSPHAKGLYRLNYNTVMSPVGMYIKSTDPQLIKNVGGNTNKYFITPPKGTPKKSSNLKIVGSSTPSIDQVRSKSSVKTKQSPTIRPSSSHSIRDQFKEKNVTPTHDKQCKLPKVNYQLPLKVYTVKQDETTDKQRVKTLLQSTPNKIIVHHQGRANSVQKRAGQDATKNNEMLEINYHPESDSIHVEQIAARTNFLGRRNYI